MNCADLIQRQRGFFDSGATRPLEFRRHALRRLGQAIRAHEASLLAALRADLGKSPHEAYATELGPVLSEIDHAIRRLPGWAKPRKARTPLLAWPARGQVRLEPFGVALVIGPWNYPLQLLLSPLVGALAAGNCAVLKPSEFAPRTASAVSQTVGDVFQADHVAVVEGDREVSEALLREKFDFIFFTGSTRVGRLVMAAAARQLVPVALELGGKCPCIVCPDVPVEITVRRIAWGKFMNCGQTCVAPDFLLVHRSICRPLMDELASAIRKFYGKDPRQSPDYGRIVNRQHFDRLRGYLGTGRVEFGGDCDEATLYIGPTLLLGAPPQSEVMTEEIFGPILPVLEFTEIEEALHLVRERPAPLALYLFTNDQAIQKRVVASTRSGGVCINDTVTHMVGKHLPFGGLGDSGFGSYHGRASFDCFSHRRSILTRSFRFDSQMRNPPPKVSLRALQKIFPFLLR